MSRFVARFVHNGTQAAVVGNNAKGGLMASHRDYVLSHPEIIFDGTCEDLATSGEKTEFWMIDGLEVDDVRRLCANAPLFLAGLYMSAQLFVLRNDVAFDHVFYCI